MPDTRIIDDDMDIKLFNGFPILDELIDEEYLDVSRFEIKKCKNNLKKGRTFRQRTKITTCIIK